jgi:hypothetical protein
MDNDKGFFSGAVGEKIEADLLRKSVEGQESPMAYVLNEGRPAMSAQGIALNAPVNRQLLIDFLRSDRPIGDDVRNWLADLLDPHKSTNANLSLSRRRGKVKSNMLGYVDAVSAYIDQRDIDDGYDAAIAHVSEKFGIKKGTLKKAVSRLEEGIRIHRESQRNH